MAVEAQGVHEAKNRGFGTPAEAALGRVELWQDVGRDASINQVLENFKGAGGERNGTIGVKRGGATIALDGRNNQAGLPSCNSIGKPQTLNLKT